MHHAVLLILGLAALGAAGAAGAHAGFHPHSHPHPDFDLYVLIAAVVGALLGVLYAGRGKRKKWGQTPASTGDGGGSGGKNGA
jgi:hypothetical protein